MDATTVCYACGRRYDATCKRCDCGEAVWFETDPTEFEWPPAREQGMWAYADLLPIDPPSDLAIAAGGTPLVRTPRLDEFAGCTVFCKDEAENPTGSFKDRGSAVAVTAAQERGTPWIGTVSHGNMAMSTAAHAAAADLRCAVFVPEDVSTARLTAIAQYGPEIVRVRGDYGRLYRETLATDAPDIEFVNSDTPLRVAGQKTVAYEICERFALDGPDGSDGPSGPDAIALPVSSGGQASAVWKGLRELRVAGLLVDLPKIYLMQAAACAPIAAAYRDGADEVIPVDPGETIAYSIANPDPPSGTRALAAVRATGGAVVAVPDEGTRVAQSEMARKAGLCVEPASATALAGLRQLSERGEIEPSDEVAVIVTGTGFKELTDSHTEQGRIVNVEDVPGLLADLPTDAKE